MQAPTVVLISITRPVLLHRQSEKCIAKGSKYAHWIGLYLSFHLSWLSDPFVHGRLQNLKTNEDTFAHDITLLRDSIMELRSSCFIRMTSLSQWSVFRQVYCLAHREGTLWVSLLHSSLRPESRGKGILFSC